MAQKPEIQYIGQFYVYGSEVKAEELKKQEQPRFRLPKPKMEKIQKIYIDPVALCGIIVAVAILIAMAVGAKQLQDSWNEYNVVQAHLTELKRENARIEHTYRTSYDLEHVRTAAENMGLVPVSEVKVMQVKVTIPEPKPVPTAWDNFKWFMRGLVD